MKYHFVLILIILLFASCKDNRMITIPFTKDFTSCDGSGIPKSNAELYFPRELFKGPDTDFDLDVFQNYDSKMLFKLNEPILYHRYLGKEIYRMISFRAFDRPLIIRIEIHKKQVNVQIKKVEHYVTFPFRLHVKVYDSTFYDYPNVSYYDSIQKKYVVNNQELFQKLYNENVRESDSLFNLFKDPDYKYILYKTLTLKLKDFNSFFTYLRASEFWQTNPDLNLESIPSIDGSHWIFEGHSKYGYQVKMIDSPDFDKIPQKSKYTDPTGQYFYKIKYAELFSYILNIAQLPDERKY